jgi:two-component system phosphate regulon sensor histidine kinase PhoR
MPVELRPIDLRDVVRQAVTIMQPLAGSGSPIAVDFPETEVPVLGDEARLETVVTNLLDNAVKYSPSRAPVACALTVQGGNALLTVEDQGIGIDSRDLPRLFGRFSRIVTEVNASIGGTGLGLYIAREIVRQHHGDITVTSRLGAGTTFCVTLPLRSDGSIEATGR